MTEAAVTDEIDHLADANWNGITDSRLVGAWQHLRVFRDSKDRGARTQEATDLESDHGVETRVLEDYSGRYPIELLQNAQDAAAEKHLRNATVWMHVSDTALLVGNEGRPFDEDRLKGLLNLAVGTKRAANPDHHTIGYKGIGFTSVFEITDAPQVFSAGYEFCLDSSRAKVLAEAALGHQLPGVPRRRFAFPLEQDDIGGDLEHIQRMRADGAVTIIRLPLTRMPNGGAQIVREFIEATLGPEVLLFMPAIARLTLSGQGPKREWSLTRGKKLAGGKLATLKDEAGTRQSWLVYERRTPLDSGIASRLEQDVWRSARDVNASVAVPWHRGKPDSNRGSRSLRVFFPTSDTTGRGLLIHGDFYVHSDRTRIHTAGAGGKVTNAVAELVADMVSDIASRHRRSGADTLACLAPLGTVNGFGSELNKLIDGRLTGTAFLRAARGRAAQEPSTLYALGPATTTADAELITAVMDRDQAEIFLHPADGTRADVLCWLTTLGLDVAEPQDVFGWIDPGAGQRSYDRILAALGRYRAQHKLSAAGLRNSRVVQNERQEWVSPADTAVRVDGLPPLPPGLDVSTVRLPRTPEARRFVELLPVPELNARRAAEIAVSAAESDDHLDPTPVLQYLHLLWRKHREQLGSVDAGGVRVPCRSARGKTVEWVPASQSYFPSTWSSDKLLEQLYGGLGQREFLVDDPLGDGSHDTRFFEWLGVAREPRISLDHPESFWWSDIHRWPWADAVGLAAADHCHDRHMSSQREIVRPTMDRFTELIDASASTRMALARFVGENPALLGRASLRCTNSEHRGHARPVEREGEISWMMRERPWLPAVVGDHRRLELRPVECWTDLPEVEPTVELPLVDLPAAMGDALGCGNPRRPTVDALVAGLERLSTSRPDLDAAPEAEVATADWLFARLHAALKNQPSRLLDCPVPAWRIDGRAWAPSPLLADVEGLDDLEGVSWIPLGTDSRTYKALGLRRASEVVTATPLAVGARFRDDVVSTSARLELYALLESEVEDLGRLAFRLAKLEQVTVEHLDVELLHEGRSVRRSQHMYLQTLHDKRNRLNGGCLYLRADWRSNQQAVAQRIAGYLDEDMSDRILHFLDDPRAALTLHGVDDVAVSSAEARLQKYKRRQRDVEDLTVPEPSQPSGHETTHGPAKVPDEPSTPDEKRSTPSGRTPSSTDRDQGAKKDTTPEPGERTARKLTTSRPPPRPKQRRKQPRYVTYVPPPGSMADKLAKEVASARTRTDELGVERVCVYELAAGRFPRVLDHGNKGYDIESYATVARSGEVERYIEVKSKQGSWDGFNVRLSRAQLEFGKGPNGSRTWLYVVENTGSEQPAVHAIPRVSMLADGFYFDEGWKALSEDPAVTSESVLDGVLSLFLDEVQPLLAELLRLGAEVPMTIEDPIRDLPHFAREWVVEAGWPSASVALVTDTDAARDDYLRGSGWSVVHVGEAAVDVLAQLLGLEDHGDGSE